MRLESLRADEDWSDYARTTSVAAPNGCIMQILATPWTTTTKDPQMERWSSFKQDLERLLKVERRWKCSQCWSKHWRMPNTQEQFSIEKKMPPKVIFKLAASLCPQILTLLKRPLGAIWVTPTCCKPNKILMGGPIIEEVSSSILKNQLHTCPPLAQNPYMGFKVVVFERLNLEKKKYHPMNCHHWAQNLGGADK